MKWFDVGAEAEGFIAIGQLATGFIAIGQLATGFIAIGQLARGVIVIGQLAVGVVAFGQLVLSLTYGGGMVGVAGIRMRPALLVYGVAGAVAPRREPHGVSAIEPVRETWFTPLVWDRSKGGYTVVRVVVGAALIAAVWLIALSWIDDLDDPDDVPPTPTPTTTTHAPGTR